ncbi:MAG TPA: galactokinase, partial [Candidatus Dormibacteraeota bacterium]
ICATLVALLQLRATTLSVAALVDAAYVAEHTVLGVPSGRLDQHAIVETPDGGAVLLDCATDSATPIAWGITGAALCVCDTGERHSVAGPGYRTRRAETEAALRAAGAATIMEIAAPPEGADIAARRLRHAVTESRRAAEAAAALRAGDSRVLGRLMSESHRSLREDAEVSTATLDTVVAAAQAVPGCFGARLVGAGFGGSVLALTGGDAAAACIDAMLEAAGPGASAWVVAPAAGLAITAGATVTRR